MTPISGRPPSGAGSFRERAWRRFTAAGHDGSRSRPLLRWAYESTVRAETAAAALWRSRKAVEPVDPGTVTLTVKTFERPAVLRRMLASVRRVFAGPIIVADDSRTGFRTDDPGVRVLRLPFDSGIGAGRNALLDAVDTDYLFMTDDDMTLLPDFDLARPLAYLERNARVDLVGGRVVNLPLWRSPDYAAAALFAYRGAPRERQGVLVDGLPVSYKVPNFYLARTERLRAVRYDDRLKRLDHRDFFTSAYGELLCVVDPAMVCLHAHSFFDPHYQSFRTDYGADQRYLGTKWDSSGQPAVATDPDRGPTEAQRIALHHAAVEAVARDLGVQTVHHGGPLDPTVTISVADAELDLLLRTLRTLGWRGTGRRLTHALWGELRLRTGLPVDAVPAAFGTVRGLAHGGAWPRPVPRTPTVEDLAPAEATVRWHPRSGWLDDGTAVVGAALPLGPVQRLEFPGDRIWEIVGPDGTPISQVVRDVLAGFDTPPPEAAGQIRDYLDDLVAQGLLERTG